MMRGDQLQIFYVVHDGHTVLHDTVDDWHTAKAIRNAVFAATGTARAVWIMRINVGLQLQPRRWGATLRRTRKEAQCTAS